MPSKTSHPKVEQTKQEKVVSGLAMIETLKNLDKTKKDIVKSMVLSGYKIRQARSLYKQSIAYKHH